MTTAAAGTAVDPRLKKRRVAVLRAQGRRRLRILVAILLPAAAAAGVYALSQSALLDLDDVEIRGVPPDQAVEVADAAAVALGTPLVSLDLSAIADSVASLPWVRSAQVRRGWPGSLQVEVVERVPIAVLAAGGGRHVLVDGDGIATHAVGSRGDGSLLRGDGSLLRIDGSLLRIDGSLLRIDAAPTGALGDVQTAVLPALAVVSAMPDDLADWVEAVTIAGVSGPGVSDPGVAGSGGSGLGLDLVGTASVELGNASHIPDKLESLRSVLASVDLRCIELIDVRVADVTTVRRDPACEMRSL